MSSSEFKPQRVPCHEFHIVGVGASAGGLEALEQFFESIPPDSGMAYVVVQHLSPDFKSHMEELLSRRTRMKILRVENGMKVNPNSIYLIPPKMEMVIAEGKLLLTEKGPARELSHPIDQFFRSLAGDCGRYSIGIVLSGTGSDGSRGVREIHESGGLVLAQSAETSKFDGMPLNAQATGAVALSASPEGIAKALLRYVKEGVSRESLAENDAQIASEEGVARIFQLLRLHHGIDFSHYKASTVGRRLERRIQLGNHLNVEKYVENIESNREELNQLYKDLLIGVTRFFRDKEAFDRLATEVIPQIVGDCPRGHAIRVWSAGCASGEEAYSIAMLFNDCIEAMRRPVELKVFATDAHHVSLSTAARGVYSDESLSELSAAQRHKYFRNHQDGNQVSRELRQLVLFAPHNVISDAPFTQMDLVVCRNLLIYFQPQPQKKALSMFHFALKTGGVLFLGPSESPGDIADEFQVIDPRWRMYRKRRDIRLPVDARAPLATGGTMLPRSAFSLGSSTVAPRVDRSLLSTYDILLDRFMPPGILISESLELSHTFAGGERYTRIRKGRATNNIFEIIDESLRTPLAGAIQQSVASNERVRYSGIQFPTATGMQSLTLLVEPIYEPVSRVTNYLIRFEHEDQAANNETASNEAASNEAASNHGASNQGASKQGMESHVKPSATHYKNSSNDQVDVLETELRFTRENLQATIEELETSNEELQSTNEELVASNEELQSTNEELHSVNEELFTVNAEHQRRVEELAEANDDMDNLLATTRVGVIFLDQTLSIRRYTPEIAKVFHIVQQDIGRSIRSFAHNLKYDNLIQDLEQVLRSGREHEVEVRDQNGNYFLMRMTAYQSANKHRGVVVTLVDINARLAAERELHMRQLAINAASNGILITDPRRPDNPITYSNRGFTGMTGYTAEEVVGRNCRFLQGEATDQRAVVRLRESIAKGEDCRVTLLNYRSDGTKFWNHLQITAVRDEAGELVNFVGVQHDITEQVEAKERARETAERIQALLDSTAEGIYGLDHEGRCSFCNRACVDMLGYESAEQLIGQDMHTLIHHSCQDGAALQKEDSPIFRAFKSGERINVDSDYFWRADGTSFPVEYWSHPINRDDNITGAVVTFVDTTQRRQQREELQRANEAANAANRAKSQFLANMSHELRTPMAVVMGFADILLEESQDPQVIERVSVIRRNGEYLLKLMNDILDLSRVEVGALKLERCECDLKDLLHDLRDMMEVRAAEVCRPIDFHLPYQLPITITTDRARVRQVMVNLIGNAIKFSPNGRVDVTVQMTTLEGEPALSFIVSDNGIGMSEEQKLCIFQPFSQANETVAKAFGGTGLGLSISKRLIDSLGGKLELESTEGQGSTFTATFPVGPIGEFFFLNLQANESVVIPSFSENVSLSARILLADDMRDVRHVARHFLEKAGAVVKVVENGRDAVDAIAHAIETGEPFELAIIDMQMPEMNGMEAIEELRNRKIDIPAIALTADAMKGTRRRVLDAGFDEYLAKPITAQSLVRTSLNTIRRCQESRAAKTS